MQHQFIRLPQFLVLKTTSPPFGWPVLEQVKIHPCNARNKTVTEFNREVRPNECAPDDVFILMGSSPQNETEEPQLDPRVLCGTTTISNGVFDQMCAFGLLIIPADLGTFSFGSVPYSSEPAWIDFNIKASTFFSSQQGLLLSVMHTLFSILFPREIQQEWGTHRHECRQALASLKELIGKLDITSTPFSPEDLDNLKQNIADLEVFHGATDSAFILYCEVQQLVTEQKIIAQQTWEAFHNIDDPAPNNNQQTEISEKKRLLYADIHNCVDATETIWRRFLELFHFYCHPVQKKFVLGKELLEGINSTIAHINKLCIVVSEEDIASNVERSLRESHETLAREFSSRNIPYQPPRTIPSHSEILSALSGSNATPTGTPTLSPTVSTLSFSSARTSSPCITQSSLLRSSMLKPIQTPGNPGCIKCIEEQIFNDKLSQIYRARQVVSKFL